VAEKCSSKQKIRKRFSKRSLTLLTE